MAREGEGKPGRMVSPPERLQGGVGKDAQCSRMGPAGGLERRCSGSLDREGAASEGELPGERKAGGGKGRCFLPDPGQQGTELQRGGDGLFRGAAFRSGSGSQGWLTATSGGKQSLWEALRPALKPKRRDKAPVLRVA